MGWNPVENLSLPVLHLPSATMLARQLNLLIFATLAMAGAMPPHTDAIGIEQMGLAGKVLHTPQDCEGPPDIFYYCVSAPAPFGCVLVARIV